MGCLVHASSLAWLGLVLLLAAPGSAAAAPPLVLHETFDELDPALWAKGYRHQWDALVWGTDGLGDTHVKDGEARLRGAWEVNQLLGLHGLDIQGDIVIFRAKYSGAYDFSYWVVLSDEANLTDEDAYASILPFDNENDGQGIAKSYQTYQLSARQDGVSVLTSSSSYQANSSLPGARWVYWVEANEDRTLHLDDVRVFEGAGYGFDGFPCLAGLRAEALPAARIRLTWPAVDGATGYHVAKVTPSSYHLVATLDEGEGSWTGQSEEGAAGSYVVRGHFGGPTGVPFCPVEVVAVPVFPSVVGGLLAVGSAAWLGLRRRA